MAPADEIVFLHGSHLPRCIASVDKRFDYHVLQFMTKGGVEACYGHDRHVLLGAWTWPCWPGAHVRFHEWPRGTPWDHRYIAFAGPLAASWRATGLLSVEPEPIERSDLRAFASDFDAMLEASRRPDRWGKQLARNLLENLLLRRAEARARSARSPTAPAQRVDPWLADVLGALDAAPGDGSPDYAALAETAGLSLSTLRRRFRAATGVAIHQYALQRRLLTAKDLLARGELSIKQIARQTGYRDVYYFNRHFRQAFSVPPGKYRKSVQG